MGETKMNRKLIVAGLAAILIIIVGYLAYTSLTFRLLSSEPKDKKASSLAPVIFSFNKDLDQKTASEFTISPAVAGKTTVTGKKLTFQPSSPYTFNQTYVVTLKHAYSKTGQVVGAQKLTFESIFVPVDQQSATERQAQQAATDSGKDKYPILAKLPYETEEFKIDYQPATSADGEKTIIINVELRSTINDSRLAAEYQQELVTHKQQALTWLKTNGVDPNKTYIQFSPDPDGDSTNTTTD
jgi:hypothetical protein